MNLSSKDSSNSNIAQTNSVPAEGLNSPNIMQKFAQDMGRLEALWSSVPFTSSKPNSDRPSVIGIMANKALNSAGVPSIKKIVPKYSSPNTVVSGGAKFDQKNWTIVVDQEILEKSKLDNGDMGGRDLNFTTAAGEKQTEGLANVIYHEMRHAEQWFHMAQLLAVTPMANGQKRNAQQISKELGIPVEVSQKAIDIPIKQSQIKDAKDWYQSIFLEKDKRNAILKKIYQGDNSPATLKAYYDLKEEKDAFQTGFKLQKVYQKLFPNKKSIEKDKATDFDNIKAVSKVESQKSLSDFDQIANVAKKQSKELQEIGLNVLENRDHLLTVVAAVAINSGRDPKEILRESPDFLSASSENRETLLNNWVDKAKKAIAGETTKAPETPRKTERGGQEM